MGRPRIAEADLLTADDLLYGGLEGEWVRTAAYKEGHRVSRVGHSARCGAPLVVDELWWERFQAQLIEWSGHEIRAKGPTKWSPTEWFIARDTRTTGKCSACKHEDLIEDNPVPALSSELSFSTEMSAPFIDPTPADQLERQRFLTKVAWVARELDATEVTPGSFLAA